jgi:hypothetical protein
MCIGASEVREGLEMPQVKNGTMNPFHFYRFGSTTPAAITFTSAATACRVASLRATRGPSPPALPTIPLALPVTLLRAADTQCAAASALCERLTHVKCSTLVGRAFGRTRAAVSWSWRRCAGHARLRLPIAKY